MLDGRARRLWEPMAEERIREIARIERADGPERPPAELIDFLIAFEQRYGGLWYPVVGGNGMEHGLDGEANLYVTDFGLALPGILDGDATRHVNILIDGRTTMAAGRGFPDLVIDSSVGQRIESHALLVEVRRWAHRVYRLTCALNADPIPRVPELPPTVPEATGAGSRWWFDGESAVYARLRGRCRAPRTGRDGVNLPQVWWTIWCFARDAAALSDIGSRLEQALPSESKASEAWCMLCQEPHDPARPARHQTNRSSS